MILHVVLCMLIGMDAEKGPPKPKKEPSTRTLEIEFQPQPGRRPETPVLHISPELAKSLLKDAPSEKGSFLQRPQTIMTGLALSAALAFAGLGFARLGGGRPRRWGMPLAVLVVAGIGILALLPDPVSADLATGRPKADTMEGAVTIEVVSKGDAVTIEVSPSLLETVSKKISPETKK